MGAHILADLFVELHPTTYYRLIYRHLTISHLLKLLYLTDTLNMRSRYLPRRRLHRRHHHSSPTLRSRTRPTSQHQQAACHWIRKPKSTTTKTYRSRHTKAEDVLTLALEEKRPRPSRTQSHRKPVQIFPLKKSDKTARFAKTQLAMITL